MHNPLDVAAHAVERALAAGADEAEATVVTSERFSAEARAATLTKLEQSTGRTLVVRAFVRGAKASLATSDFTPAGIDAHVRRAVEAARFVARDSLAGLPDAEPADAPDLGIFASDVGDRALEAKIDDALALERCVRAADARIVNSSGSRVGDARTEVALANSRGFRGSYRATTVTRGTSPVALDGETRRTASHGSAARSYASVEPIDAIAALAAKRATELFGARKPQTARLPVIFERDVAGAVLGDVFAAVSAANVAIGNSFLADRVGERVASDLVTILDDGRVPGGLGTSPFDAEGVATRCTPVVDRGVLRTFLYDTYYARKLGAHSTGNAAGGTVGPNNFYLRPGTATLAETIAATPRGVLVLETIGFSTENVTGTYSRGARGLMIEGGEVAYPIDEFTIAGNLASMLAAIDAVANDLVFDGSVVAPSFRVAEMTVSGR